VLTFSYATVILGVAAFAVAAVTGWLFAWWLFLRERERARARAERAERDAELQVAQMKHALELELKSARHQLQSEHLERESRLRSREDEVVATLLAAEKEKDRYEQRRAELETRMDGIDAREIELKALVSGYRRKLEELAEMDLEAVRAALREEVQRDCAEELIALRDELLNRSEKDVTDDARRVLLASMQRLSTKPQHDITATIVRIPSEDMKGRIIGREGRNIKSFESVTGTTLLIDETPDSVLISSFDPVRREVARIALEDLVRDGRIHPASIEDAVKRAEEEVSRSVTELGEDAVRRLRITGLHPEVTALVGRLRYRLSNNQNSLDHSIEVANLCALMAAELGLDTDIAKRCGLLHDIGKVLGEEYPGSHAAAGASFIKRYGKEDPRVINAVAAHHCEVPAESPYASLLMIADSLSAMRPGARAESIDSYIQRVRTLEEIARSFPGVSEAYAIQAGREIRVIVEPGEVRDREARLLARDIRRRIEEEMQYPGTIKITVIRESRVTETAK